MIFIVIQIFGNNQPASTIGIDKVRFSHRSSLLSIDRKDATMNSVLGRPNNRQEKMKNDTLSKDFSRNNGGPYSN